MTSSDLTPVRFTVEQAHRARDEWGANCGPGALAGVMSMTLDEVHPHIPNFDTKRYTSPAMMNAALRNIGVGWRKIGSVWPYYGLVRIQWDGPWMAPDRPHTERYPETHWIGYDAYNGIEYDGGLTSAVFDINCMNCGGWVSFTEWDTSVVPWLLGPPATGKWNISCAIEIDRPTVARTKTVATA